MSRCLRFFSVPMIAAQVFAAAGVFFAAPSAAQEPKPDNDAIVFALMSGKCPMLKIAGRNFRCRAVAFSQSEQGRARNATAGDGLYEPLGLSEPAVIRVHVDHRHCEERSFEAIQGQMRYSWIASLRSQ